MKPPRYVATRCEYCGRVIEANIERAVCFEIPDRMFAVFCARDCHCAAHGTPYNRWPNVRLSKRGK